MKRLVMSRAVRRTLLALVIVALVGVVGFAASASSSVKKVALKTVAPFDATTFASLVTTYQTAVVAQTAAPSPANLAAQQAAYAAVLTYAQNGVAACVDAPTTTTALNTIQTAAVLTSADFDNALAYVGNVAAITYTAPSWTGSVLSTFAGPRILAGNASGILLGSAMFAGIYNDVSLTAFCNSSAFLSPVSGWSYVVNNGGSPTVGPGLCSRFSTPTAMLSAFQATYIANPASLMGLRAFMPLNWVSGPTYISLVTQLLGNTPTAARVALQPVRTDLALAMVDSTLTTAQQAQATADMTQLLSIYDALGIPR